MITHELLNPPLQNPLCELPIQGRSSSRQKHRGHVCIIYIYIYIYIYIHTHTNTYAHTYTYTYTYRYRYMYVCIYVCMYVCIYIYIYIHIHIYIYILQSEILRIRFQCKFPIFWRSSSLKDKTLIESNPYMCRSLV